MKKFSLLFIFILLIACSNDDNNDQTNEVIEPNASQLKIQIEGVNEINYNSVTAISINNQNPIDENGIFDNPYENNNIEDLPVLLLENQEIIAGYYPNMLTSNKVKIDDILFYFFKTNPRIVIQAISDTALKSQIQSLNQYNQLKDILVSSLNNNISPLTNESFISIIQSFATNESQNRNSQTTVGEFSFLYERDGLTNWTTEIPLFASIGVAIRNTETNEVVFGPKLLKTKNLDLNASTLVTWIQEQFGEPVSPLTSSYQFQQDGEYELFISNSNSEIDALNRAVLNRNINDVTALAFTSIMSVGVQALAGNSSCNQALASLFNTNFDFFSTHFINGTEPTLEEVKIQLQATGIQFLSSIADCGISSTAYLFFSSIISATLGIINTALDIFEILSIIKESSILSNINVSETRFLNNGISFGELQVSNESQTNFSGAEFDEFQYSKTITEKNVIYDIERSLTVASFNPDIYDDGAKDLPFKFNIISGDTFVFNNDVSFTNAGGIFEFNMSMGTQDSEILVYPDFQSDVISETTLNLINTENQIEGWYQVNYFLANNTTVCDIQSGNEIKFYVNLLENNGNFSGTIYYREIDAVYGVPESSFSIEPFQAFGNNQLASSSENFVGDPNVCDYSNVMVSLYVDTDGSNLEMAYGINMCQNEMPNECAVQSYGQTPTLMTYIGTETPSDL